MATVVAWWTVSQSLAVLAQVSRVNQRHHILVPGLGSCTLIGRTGQGTEDATGRGAPNSKVDGDRRPAVAVLLHLTVVDTAVRQLGAPNQDASLNHNQLVTCYYLEGHDACVGLMCLYDNLDSVNELVVNIFKT